MPILGVDTGGTFTDFYLIADDGTARVYKRPSTPDDPARGILEGLREMGAAPEEMVHGTTVATNAIIERKGARTALITTKGFRDALVIGRQTRPKLYDLSPRREPPLVADELRLEADERLDFRGGVLTPLDPAEVETLLEYLHQERVESLAVCFLFSFVNPEHERIVTEAARKRGLPVSASHEVLPEHREYERTSTTVANAYVAPVMTRYLERLENRMRQHGVKRLRVMTSNGGSASATAASRLAIRTAVSGPAGGVAGAFALAQAVGCNRIITFDMGGTSTDVSLCPGRILERDETRVGELPIRGPTVDVLSVGAGGGSIAHIDAGGALRVGPESAGAEPGPACYGRGQEPTVTDAQMALGRIVPEHFLGGRMAIHPELSVKALARVAGAFDGDPCAGAAAVLRVANANMERALRVVSVERGHDPREFTLVAFGGAGPLHACDLATGLRIPRVLVPRYPGVLSALGMATAPVVKDLSASVLIWFPGTEARPRASTQDKRLVSAQRQLLDRGRSELKSEGFSMGGVTEQTILDMRYAGQSYELPVPADSLAPRRFLAAFHADHLERYGHADQSRPVEVVNLRAKLILPTEGVEDISSLPRRPRAARPPSAIVRRPVYFPDHARGPLPTPFYERDGLRRGTRLEGPAVITQMDSTTVLPPGWQAEIDEALNMVLATV